MLKRTADRVFLVGAALLVVATPLFAADWTGAKPWWCNPNADACGKYSSATTYVGPTHTQCYYMTQNTWQDDQYVGTTCQDS